jgi:pimeloyl-ACP methyl ester carboxylesterase
MTTTTVPDRTNRTVHANGIDVHYVEAGSPDLPDLLLLHGGLISTNPIWDATPLSYGTYVDDLAQRFHVVAPDARGCGRTGRTDARLSVSLLADDVAALIGALGLDRPTVAGFSLGGTVATVLAIRHAGITGAIVNDSGYDVFDPDAPVFELGRMVFGGSADATTADPDATAAAFAGDPHMAGVFELMRVDQDGPGGPGWRDYLASYYEVLTTWPGYSFADLAAIDVPTLVLVGDRDSFCSVEDGVRAYRGLTDGQLAVVPGTDHVITAEKIALTAAAAGLRRH